MVKKYLIIPGYVESKNDGKPHYVSAIKLIRLYGVNPLEYIVYRKKNIRFTMQQYSNLIPLDARKNGKYILPKENAHK